MKTAVNSERLLVDLRKYAEQLLLSNPDVAKPITVNNIQELIYELNVHHIELEMQNDELIKAQFILEESRNRYADLYDFAPVGYFTLDGMGVIKEVNLAGAKLLNIERRHLIGNSFFRFVDKECQHEFYQYCENVFKTNIKQECELKLVSDGGAHLHVQLISAVIQNVLEQHRQLQVSVIDNTLRYEAEKRIRQRELELAHFARLNIVGEMVSGLAHELNQPLTAIVHYTGGCLARLTDKKIDPEIKEMMQRVMKQAERVGGIVHRLKAFLRKEPINKTVLDINAVVSSCVDLMEYQVKHTAVKVQFGLENTLPNIKGDSIQLEQVILNITNNAIEAMQSIDNKTVKLLSIITRRSLPNDVEIIIANNGPVIPSEWLEHIFEPFFTMKEKGMGIGLSIARSIIEEHGGRISVFSNSSMGTRFHIILPINSEME